MIKWSRIKLALSVLSAAGLWQTLAERIRFASRAPKSMRQENLPASAAYPSYYDLAGAVHVHSTYSDGTGSVPEIALAAEKAGLDFVVLTDHSSLQAQANGEDGWAANPHILVAVGSEIATDLGHVLVLDLPSDFDVEACEARDIMARVRQAGGYGCIALPCDLKDHWRDFDVRDDLFGLEVFNLSAVARTKINIPSFLLTLLRYRGKKPVSAFSFIAGRPVPELKLWDRLCLEAHHSNRPIPPAIGSIDAHAVMRFGGKNYPYPTYEEVFRTLRTHVMVSEPLRLNETERDHDLEILHQAFRSGHSYISYDNFGVPKGFSFLARTEKEVLATMGDTCILASGSRITLEIRSPRTKSIIKLIRNGKTVTSVRGSALKYSTSQTGIYRVEVENYKYRIGSLCLGVHPWIFSNPIQLRQSTES